MQEKYIEASLKKSVGEKPNPGKREESQDKYLETDFFLAKKQEKNL